MRTLVLSFLVATAVLAGPTTTCGDDEEFKNCGTMCEPTCEKPEKGFCIDQCRVNACECKSGFVRHEGKCIFEFMCPKTCSDPNEELTQCGTACEPSCEKPSPDFCTKQCLVNVCQCKSGFVRNPDGECVLPEICPKKCGTNEVIHECGSKCEPTCSDRNPTCVEICLMNVCRCQNGFVRNDKGDCIEETTCPK